MKKIKTNFKEKIWDLKLKSHMKKKKSSKHHKQPGKIKILNN